MVKILDLFSGMGGLSLGFVLGLEDAKILGLDIDRYAVDTYNHNLSRFGCRAEVQDVLKWEPKGDYDVVMGGSPCQPFSLANTRKRGKEHPLYPTFPRFFDVVLELRPKVFLLENVKGLTTRRHRPLLEEQLERVSPYYSIRWQVLNAAYFGVSQRRERLFILGIRKDLGIKPSFPNRTHSETEYIAVDGRKIFSWVTVREAIGDLLVLPPQNLLSSVQVERIKREREDTSRHLAKMGFPDNLDKPSRTISSHTVEGTKRETIVVPVTEHIMTEKGGWANPQSDWGSRVMPLSKPAYTITEKHRSGQLIPVADHDVRYYDMEFSNEVIRKHRPQILDKPSSTVRASFYKVPPDATIKVKNKYRRLTVRECLRLQSFPDWWSFPSDVSVSRKYKLVGEAVPPALAYRLAVHIGKLMGWEVREPPREDEWCLPYFRRMFADYFVQHG